MRLVLIPVVVALMVWGGSRLERRRDRLELDQDSNRRVRHELKRHDR